MASLLKRTVILSFSRFANRAVVLLSPVLLVRILPVTEYGSYREFLLYVGLISPLVSFGVGGSLQYLLPKHPDQEPVWVSQAILFVLAFSSAAVIAIHIAGDLIRANTSFDFVTSLQLYVVFLVNLDYIELYWLGKKRTDNVLYYTLARLTSRMVVVVVAAYVTEDARLIIYSLIALEAVRCLLVFLYTAFKGLFTSRIHRKSLALQASYFLPLGTGAAVETINSSVGSLFVSTVMGASALAFYVIGSFATKFVEIFRGAIADVVFPEMVEVRSATPKDALPLWHRATIWYCMLLFPLAVLSTYYSDAIVTVLFTREYSSAIPVFSTFALLLFLYCFDFHLPLRAQNANRYFLLGSVLALIINVSLSYPMLRLFGLAGPAMAFILSRLAITGYLARHTMRLYKIDLGELVHWSEVGKILIASLVCVPVLIAGKYAFDNLFVRASVFGTFYLAVYFMMLRFLSVSEASTLYRRFSAIKLAIQSRRGRGS